jgi:hypothetical protein
MPNDVLDEIKSSWLEAKRNLAINRFKNTIGNFSDNSQSSEEEIVPVIPDKVDEPKPLTLNEFDPIKDSPMEKETLELR